MVVVVVVVVKHVPKGVVSKCINKENIGFIYKNSTLYLKKKKNKEKN